MKITVNANFPEPTVVVGIRNLTQGFWRFDQDRVLYVGAEQPEYNGASGYARHAPFTVIFRTDRITRPLMSVMETEAIGWTTKEFTKLESGTINITW